MKKLLLTLLLTLGFIGTSHSNILDNLLGNMSTSDVKFYDKTYTSVGYNSVLGYTPAEIHYRAKIKNLNQEKSIKNVYIKIKTLDCKKGCKDCITADIGVYEVLEDTSLFSSFGDTILRPNTTFQVNIRIDDETQSGTYVQASGNETCWNSSIDKVKGFHIFE